MIKSCIICSYHWCLCFSSIFYFKDIANCHILKAMTTVFALQDRDTNRQQSPCGDSMVGVGDGGKEMEGCVDQLMGLGECETVHSSSAFEQWDSYWEDLTRYWVIIHLCT